MVFRGVETTNQFGVSAMCAIYQNVMKAIKLYLANPSKIYHFGLWYILPSSI